MSLRKSWIPWAARGALAVVLAWNLQAALALIVAPDTQVMAL